MATSEHLRDYYDRHASIYDDLTGFGSAGGHAYNFRRYCEPLLERQVPSSGRVLELGCGTGFYTRWLADRGLKVFAMDISSEMIERAKLRCPNGVSFFVGNCEHPAAALDSEVVREGVDAIIAINTFSYYSNKLEALRNYRELLRENGRLVVLDMNGTSLTQHLAYLTNYRGARRFARNIGESTLTNLRSMLEKSGFAVETMKRFAFVPNRVNESLIALFAPLDRMLSRVPLADIFAFRIFWVARKIE